jgi:hypothetical protein
MFLHQPNWSETMTSKKNDKVKKSTGPGDTEASLQKELSREATEGADSIGDVGSNRTLTGSSSWETLPDKAKPGEGATKSGTKPGSAPVAPRRKKK